MVPTLQRASDLLSLRGTADLEPAHRICWNAREILVGSVVQLSGDAALSIAVAIASHFLRGQSVPVPWVLVDRELPFPPDLVAAGLPLEGIIWFQTALLSEALYTVDTLLGSAQFPLVCMDLRDSSRITPGGIARYMHRLRHSGFTLLIIAPDTLRTPAPGIAFHIVATTVTAGGENSSFGGEIALEVLRSRYPFRDCTCHVSSAVPLS